MKTIYIVRHCSATGQSPDAELSELGYQQATELASFFEHVPVEQIICSPFLRAQHSIAPTADSRKLSVLLDDRLSERTLSTTDIPNWLEILEQTFIDMDLKLTGGESSHEAMARGIEVVKSASNNCILVTHGNLMSLLLKHFDHSFGFTEWKSLSNPDVYKLMIGEKESSISRLW